MKGKIEKIGVISKDKIFQAEKPRYSVSFKTGGYKTEKDRPRKRYKPRDVE